MMLHHPTYDKLNKLRLFGMARALHDQGSLDLDHLGFEERLGLLVDREATERDGRQLALRLVRAKLKPNTVAEDTDYRHARGLDKPLFQRLLAGQWLSEKQNVLLTGPTGVGKTWLACALAHQACRQGYSAYYVRLPRLLDELSIGRADGRYTKLLKQLARIDALVIDDWGLAVLDDVHRRDLLEVLDDRHGARSTIVTSQLLRGRARKSCNAMNSFMRSPSARTPLLSASSGFPSMHNRDVFVSRVGKTGGHHVCKVLRISTENR